MIQQSTLIELYEHSSIVIMDWMRGEVNWRIWGLICGELGLRATVPAVLQYPRVLFTSRVVATARVGGAQLTSRPVRPLTPDITTPFSEQLVLELQHGHLDKDSTPHKLMT
jgi:hypothetical protein